MCQAQVCAPSLVEYLGDLGSVDATDGRLTAIEHMPAPGRTALDDQSIEQVRSMCCHQFRPGGEGLARAVEVQQLKVAGDRTADEAPGIDAAANQAGTSAGFGGRDW